MSLPSKPRSTLEDIVLKEQKLSKEVRTFDDLQYVLNGIINQEFRRSTFAQRFLSNWRSLENCAAGKHVYGVLFPNYKIVSLLKKIPDDCEISKTSLEEAASLMVENWIMNSNFGNLKCKTTLLVFSNNILFEFYY